MRERAPRCCTQRLGHDLEGHETKKRRKIEQDDKFCGERLGAARRAECMRGRRCRGSEGAPRPLPKPPQAVQKEGAARREGERRRCAPAAQLALLQHVLVGVRLLVRLFVQLLQHLVQILCAVSRHELPLRQIVRRRRRGRRQPCAHRRRTAEEIHLALVKHHDAAQELSCKAQGKRRLRVGDEVAARRK